MEYKKMANLIDNKIADAVTRLSNSRVTKVSKNLKQKYRNGHK